MKLTKSAQAERDRIVDIHRIAAMEVVKMMLAAGLPGGTKREREKRRWMLAGFQQATEALRTAIDGNAPDQGGDK